MEWTTAKKAAQLLGTMTDDIIRLREEITEQRRALENMKKMAESFQTMS